MKRISRPAARLLALAVIGAIASGPALAQGRGHEGRGHTKERVEHRGNRDTHGRAHGHAGFDDHQRAMIHGYYAAEMRRGHCPPGLAKKRNGCQPPGHAKRYTIGRPLPRDVIFHELPRRLAIELGPPPRGYRYVRVENDILKIVVGTGLVIDALQDLGSR